MPNVDSPPLPPLHLLISQGKKRTCLPHPSCPHQLLTASLIDNLDQAISRDHGIGAVMLSCHEGKVALPPAPKVAHACRNKFSLCPQKALEKQSSSHPDTEKMTRKAEYRDTGRHLIRTIVLCPPPVNHSEQMAFKEPFTCRTVLAPLGF